MRQNTRFDHVIRESLFWGTTNPNCMIASAYVWDGKRERRSTQVAFETVFGVASPHLKRVCKTKNCFNPGHLRNTGDRSLWKRGHPYYQTYWSMIQRCSNPNTDNYPNYGGRGIVVCSRWLGSNGFEAFVGDMGKRPEGCSLDRRDNDGPYSPENCTWATRFEQNNNTRATVLLTAFGETKTRAQWLKDSRCVVGLSTLRVRLDNRWPIETALTTPPGQYLRFPKAGKTS